MENEIWKCEGGWGTALRGMQGVCLLFVMPSWRQQMDPRCFWFVRIFKAHKECLGVFPNLTAKAVLEKLWVTAAEEQDNPVKRHPPAHRSGELITNLSGFPPEG